MEQQSDRVRKTFKYKLLPAPTHEQVLETVVSRCRTLYNTAPDEHKTAWDRCHVSVTYYQQKADSPDLKAKFPEYAEVHSQVLQGVLLRLERAFAAFFQRLISGETPGYPRFQGYNGYHSFTYPQHGNGAVLDGGILSLSKIGHIPILVHRPLQGTPKTVTISREADGWYACFSCVEAPTHSLPLTGRETGIDVGPKVYLITADGELMENPRHYRKAEKALKKEQRRVAGRKQGSNRRKKAVCLLAKHHQTVRRQRRDSHHKTALALVRQYDMLYLEDLQVRNLSRHSAPQPDGSGGYLHNRARGRLVSTSPSWTLSGINSVRSSPARQHGPASEWKRCHRRARRRSAADAGARPEKSLGAHPRLPQPWPDPGS
jgi:putative transposase